MSDNLNNPYSGSHPSRSQPTLDELVGNFNSPSPMGGHRTGYQQNQPSPQKPDADEVMKQLRRALERLYTVKAMPFAVFLPSEYLGEADEYNKMADWFNDHVEEFGLAPVPWINSSSQGSVDDDHDLDEVHHGDSAAGSPIAGGTVADGAPAGDSPHGRPAGPLDGGPLAGTALAGGPFAGSPPHGHFAARPRPPRGLDVYRSVYGGPAFGAPPHGFPPFGVTPTGDLAPGTAAYRGAAAYGGTAPGVPAHARVPMGFGGGAAYGGPVPGVPAQEPAQSGYGAGRGGFSTRYYQANGYNLAPYGTHPHVGGSTARPGWDQAQGPANPANPVNLDRQAMPGSHNSLRDNSAAFRPIEALLERAKKNLESEE